LLQTGGSCAVGGSAGAGTDAGSSSDAGPGSDGSGSSSFCSLAASAFCDDFESGRACGWTTSGGTWSVTSDSTFVYTGGSGSYNSTAGSATWTDQTVEAKMKILTFGGSGSSYRAGIVARFAQSTNFYALAIDAAGDVRLLRGSSSPSGSTGTCDGIPSGLSTLTNTWIDLKIQVSGAGGNVHILTWVNGNAVHDCTTTSSTVAAGKAGVMTYGSSTRAEFDDFRVTTP
jgi:pectate lyase